MGIEPSTNHVLGKPFARERGELIWLDHGDERRYDTVLRILDGGAAIAESEARIRAIAPQPDTDYPEPTGEHRPIAGRGARRSAERRVGKACGMTVRSRWAPFTKKNKP